MLPINTMYGDGNGQVNALAQLTGPAPAMMGDRRQAFEQYLRGTGFTGQMGSPEMHAHLQQLRQQGGHPRMDFRAQYTGDHAGGPGPGNGAARAGAFDWQHAMPAGGVLGGLPAQFSPPARGGGGLPTAPTPRPMYPPQTMPAQGVAVGEPYGTPQNALATLGGMRRPVPVTRR